jgi:hypothetical protein
MTPARPKFLDPIQQLTPPPIPNPQTTCYPKLAGPFPPVTKQKEKKHR